MKSDKYSYGYSRGIDSFNNVTTEPFNNYASYYRDSWNRNQSIVNRALISNVHAHTS